MPNDITEKKGLLTKADVRKSYWLWQFFSHANYNYERMQGGSFAMAMAPIIKKLYKNDEEGIKNGLKRHLVFFNTDPNIGSVIHGITIAMEEERAEGADISDEVINATKVGLMGPMAGIGDTVVQGIVIPLVVALGISFGVDGNLFGPLLVLFGLPMILIAIAYNSWMRGYSLGRNAVTSILAGGKMKRIINAACILGCTVMGGLISQYVSLSTAIKFNIGDSAFDLQTGLFDAIMPSLLPLALTLGVYGIIRKGKISVLKLMVIIMVIGFFLGFFGIC